MKKTAYEKITELVQLNPNTATVKSALKHFTDAMLLRELQRRGAMPDAPEVTILTDAELRREYREREMREFDLQKLRQAIELKNWALVEDVYREAD